MATRNQIKAKVNESGSTTAFKSVESSKAEQNKARCIFCSRTNEMLVQTVQPWFDNRVVFVCMTCFHGKVKDMLISDK